MDFDVRFAVGLRILLKDCELRGYLCSDFLNFEVKFAERFYEV